MLGKTKKQGTIRPLDPDDPRSLDHPCQRANWLALMRELGRIAAAQEWERLHGEGKDVGTKNGAASQGSGSLCPLLKHPAKRPLNR